MIVLAFYALIGLVTLGLCALVYAYAVSTRKRVLCRSCGEPVKMEHDRVRNCPSCGANL
ncbi:MAG TPA: hypothetical protein PKZ76_16350 [Xanthomonadaceae bacterium]|nr:hypothetical protein [Xanthomonadaceae bacterium]